MTIIAPNHSISSWHSQPETTDAIIRLPTKMADTDISASCENGLYNYHVIIMHNQCGPISYQLHLAI